MYFVKGKVVNFKMEGSRFRVGRDCNESKCIKRFGDGKQAGLGTKEVAVDLMW